MNNTFRSEVLGQLRWAREHAAENRASPRIDTVRNRIRNTIELLQTVDRELPDLHVLATDRPAASREAMVSGGERDYALDNHGDMLARKVLTLFELGTLDGCEIFDDVARDVIQVLRKGEVNGRRTRPTATVEEVAVAIGNQTKRAFRGEYTPVRVEAQPNAEQVAKAVENERILRENAMLRRENEGLRGRLLRSAGRTPDGRNGRKAAS